MAYHAVRRAHIGGGGGRMGREPKKPLSQNSEEAGKLLETLSEPLRPPPLGGPAPKQAFRLTSLLTFLMSAEPHAAAAIFREVT